MVMNIEQQQQQATTAPTNNQLVRQIYSSDRSFDFDFLSAFLRSPRRDERRNVERFRHVDTTVSRPICLVLILLFTQVTLD